MGRRLIKWLTSYCAKQFTAIWRDTKTKILSSESLKHPLGDTNGKPQTMYNDSLIR